MILTFKTFCTKRSDVIRKAFVPRDGGARYRLPQIELRSRCAHSMKVCSRFRRRHHTVTAAKIFDVAPDAVERDQRSTAKMVNFEYLMESPHLDSHKDWGR